MKQEKPETYRPNPVVRRRLDFATNVLRMKKSEFVNEIVERYGHDFLQAEKALREKNWCEEINAPVP